MLWLKVRLPALMRPPPKTLTAELLAKVLLVIVALLPPKFPRPPPPLAELLAKVLLVIVTVPKLPRPPESLAAELAKKVLLVIVALLPPKFSRPPPWEQVMLLAKVLLVIVTVPKLPRPPPPVQEFPWAMVRALRVKVTPLFTWRTCFVPPPSRVTDWPLPSMCRSLLIVSVLVRGMVPLQLKLMRLSALAR